LNIVQTEWGTLLNDAKTGNHQILVLTDIWRPHPIQYISYGWDINVRAAFENAELDEMIKKAEVTTDHEKQVAIYQAIAEKVATENPILYIFARPQRFEFWQDYIKGYQPNPMASRINLKQSWLDK
jgi:ABC-type transport system substrate-binding protein